MAAMGLITPYEPWKADFINGAPIVSRRFVPDLTTG